jgi:hypothetical protein
MSKQEREPQGEQPQEEEKFYLVDRTTEDIERQLGAFRGSIKADEGMSEKMQKINKPLVDWGKRWIKAAGAELERRREQGEK